MKKRVILYNIRSAHNVGSIFRTSDGAGVEQLYLVGPTPLPVDRFGRDVAEIKKTSLGASENIPWKHVGTAASESLDETLALIKELQTEGWTVVAVEQQADSVSVYDFEVPEKVVYVLGHEVDGVPQVIMEACDQVVEIPMVGMKESLNVSVTAGIILFKQ